MEYLNTIHENKNTTLLSLINSISKRNVTDQDKIGFIKVLLLKTIPMVVMYDMRDTNIYQKGVKKSGNEFIRELGKNLFEDEYTNLLQSDALAVEEMEKQIEEMANEIAHSTLGCFAVITETLKKYKECPDFVLDRLNIMKGESEDVPMLQRREDLINRIIKLPNNAIPLIETHISGLENIYITN